MGVGGKGNSDAIDTDAKTECREVRARAGRCLSVNEVNAASSLPSKCCLAMTASSIIVCRFSLNVDCPFHISCLADLRQSPSRLLGRKNLERNSRDFYSQCQHS